MRNEVSYKKRRQKQNRILSVILILLIILVIAGGTLILMHITDRNHTSADRDTPSSESTADTSNSEISSNDVSDTGNSSTASSSSVDSEISSIIPEPEPTVTITIPDRSTFPEILDLLSEASGISADELSAQAEDLISTLPDPAAAAECYFPLEGYILSGTYELPETEPLLESLLKGSLDRISGIAVSDTYTISEILTMASIVEIESSRGGLSEHDPEQMPHIASVIYNRLNSGMQLQMDVTFQYGYNTLQPHGADEMVLQQYNTYDAPALPLGPICSPSSEAVEAVIHPETSEDLFFVFDEVGNYYYAADYNAHLENCVTAGVR